MDSYLNAVGMFISILTIDYKNKGETDSCELTILNNRRAQEYRIETVL